VEKWEKGRGNVPQVDKQEKRERKQPKKNLGGKRGNLCDSSNLEGL